MSAPSMSLEFNGLARTLGFDALLPLSATPSETPLTVRIEELSNALNSLMFGDFAGGADGYLPLQSASETRPFAVR